MRQQFTVGLCTFSYGGNGGISSEVPDIREWMVPLVANATKDPRIDNVRIWNLADTPITMTRNRAVLMARQYGVDVLVMIDSDMRPDLYAGHPDAKPFFSSSFDFLVQHYPKGPCVIGAPYCGPPPAEVVYVFRWQNLQSHNPNPDYQLEMYDRHTAVKMTGIQPCAALPTGLIMYDMRAFEITEPQEGGKPWFYYEWKDKYCAEKASTEDVTQTRDLSLLGATKLGYNPVMCNWDAWAGHWKPKCVGRPVVMDAISVGEKLREAWISGHDSSTKIVDMRATGLMKATLEASESAPPSAMIPAGFDPMGMALPEDDIAALAAMVHLFKQEHGRGPRVLEVGSWAGLSAVVMALAGAEVTCVDTWEGSKNDAGCEQYDGSRGTPLQVFMRNVKGLPIQPHVGRSPAAASDFKDGDFDIVYIDAEHDRESVVADINAWRSKAQHLIAGHDYNVFDGVKEAVAECFESPPKVVGNVWMQGV